jgi:hypothetical protein
VDHDTKKARANRQRHANALSNKIWALGRAQREYAPTETPLAEAYSRAIAALEALQEELYRVILWESLPEAMRHKLGLPVPEEAEELG